MRFIVDAQLSRQLVRNLARAGHEAAHSFDHLDPSADDVTIARLANEMGASVLSKDADFVALAKSGILQRTLVWVRVPNISNQLLWERVDRALPDIVSAARDNVRIFEVF